ncbi:MAG TPA: NADPH:quinone reductase [Ramlibacter sp.]|jgi:NADPH2:quinone reductase|uniref:NADPH:quinone reductase n=1 Tax=Ramlibacter sp. TaxID=1917967 RepID=UPI002D590D91|nr:NADPH:quinone reductase [Ramlibacter sp.]HZY19812.1 NADPH:quinone reductase [Ramlibacter sp.]
MQVAYYERTGPAAEVLQLGTWPDPAPAAGEVRVRLLWSGVNPSDVKSRAGLRSKALAFPRIVPHSDGMGIVDAVGPGVPDTRIGERVWIWNGAWGRPMGTAASFITVPQAQAVPLPAGTPDEAGACLGIPALTAMHAVLAAGGVQGERVLVAGGAGAVGHYAVQFARLLGAQQVIATVSTEPKAGLAGAAGAHLTVDYRQPDAAQRIREATGGVGVDRVVEVDIAANAGLDAEVLRPGGRVLAYGSGAGEFSLPFFPLIVKNLQLQFFIVYNLPPEDREHAIRTLLGLLAQGAVQHNIAQRLPLADIARAHELVGSGQVSGNVVLQTS